MSVFNAAAYLEEAILSILGQSFGDFEFLIVDDGSTDASAALLDRFAREDARIRLLRQRNAGLVASLNRLIAEARAPLIARMDGDDVALPERFARQIAFLRARPEVGVLGTNTHDIDCAGRIIAPGPAYPVDHAPVVASIAERSPFCHSSVMFRTALVRAAGGYRAAFAHCEDYDLWLRLAERTRFANLPQRLMLYRRSPHQVSHRHALAQQLGSAIAVMARRERQAGRPDPVDGLGRLPALGELDALFGNGAAGDVRRTVALGILHSTVALRGEGLKLILDHIRDNGGAAGLWRTVGRLLKLGEPRRALLLAAALLTHTVRRSGLGRPPSRRMKPGLPLTHL
jgi:glycosyltransferase involved in cell wall biosynthesis